jgi:hypothetical protein
MLRSIAQYAKLLGKLGWAAVSEGVLAAAGTYLDIFGGNPVADWPIPLWGWITLALVGLLVGPFVAFHHMRERYDKLLEQTELKRRLAECKRAMLQQADKGLQLQQQGPPDRATLLAWGEECKQVLEQYLGVPIANRFWLLMNERLSYPSGNDVPRELHVLIGEIGSLYARARQVTETDIVQPL